ncbi:MAG TPA: hypothetical protein P5081_13215 [Phycisphaerae bacterium]|nr:hypothetical protein [Phycisphaerae bacterium]HRW53835.1 hypothetical protein [Phycisphaerae bacterium]
MTRTYDYLPRSGGAFEAWQRNFVAYAVANAKALGLSDGEVTKLQERSVTWQKRYTNLTAARAAYGEAAAAKSRARSDLVALVRPMVARIQDAGATTDAVRAALGITIRDAAPTAADAPSSAPVVSVDTSERLRHTLHFTDSAMPSRKAKPKGVIGTEIWVYVGDADTSQVANRDIANGLDDYSFVRLATRTPVVVEFGGPDGGRTASYVLRWVNTRGEPGPLSAVATATVGA